MKNWLNWISFKDENKLMVYTTIGIYEIIDEELFYWLIDLISKKYWEIQKIHIENMCELWVLKFICE
jgi:hypothetical protein